MSRIWRCRQNHYFCEGGVFLGSPVISRYKCLLSLARNLFFSARLALSVSLSALCLCLCLPVLSVSARLNDASHVPGLENIVAHYYSRVPFRSFLNALQYLLLHILGQSVLLVKGMGIKLHSLLSFPRFLLLASSWSVQPLWSCSLQPPRKQHWV